MRLRAGLGPIDADDHVALAEADLFGERLDGVKLSEARLNGAELSHASLVVSDLSGAILDGATLVGADLTLARLNGAVLRDADLIEATLDAAFLEGTDLSNARLDHARGLEIRARAAKLIGVRAHEAELAGADLREADLSGADLSRADLGGADLRGARMDGARLDGACLRGADLTGAHVEPSRLQMADLAYAAGVLYGTSKRTIIPARFGPGGPVPPLDRRRLARLVELFAAMLGRERKSVLPELIAHFERELSLFAELQIPFPASSDGPSATELGLITGGRGPALYEKLVREMRSHGVPSDRCAMIESLGEASGFCPAGFKASVTGKRAEFQVYLRGPLGLSEVVHHLREVGLESACRAIRDGSEAMDRRHVHFLALECSAHRPLAVEAYWTLVYGDLDAPARLAATTGMLWDPPATLVNLLLRSHHPVYASVGIREGVTIPGVKLDMQLLAEQSELISPLLIDASSRILFARTMRHIPDVATLEHVGVRVEPGGRCKVALYLRPTRRAMTANQARDN
jgi:uncharacterized protein YjbI with pentapeptide repeats